VTAFIIACAVMTAAALVWVIVPLVRSRANVDDAGSRKERRISGVAIALSIPVLAAGLYAGLSNWNWQAAEQGAAMQANIDESLQSLRAKLAANPADIDGWLLLGRSYASLGQFAQAVDAFQSAYDRSQGQNIEAMIGLGEALALLDETSLAGRAGQLFEQALERAPNHPKALWYGAVAALRTGNVQRGRDRLQLLLAQDLPEEVRSVLQRQVQDLDQQLGVAPAAAPAAQAAATAEGAIQPGGRKLRVAVSIAPAVREQLNGPMPLFVLARDPAGGPPLAVQRHSSAELPLTVELSEQDAMMPSRSIATATRVQVVARLSRSGAPQASSGDFYGEAAYDFADQPSGQGGILNIMIDRTVP
jgi:cytochrome c-type biogenesis protein CcmH